MHWCKFIRSSVQHYEILTRPEYDFRRIRQLVLSSSTGIHGIIVQKKIVSCSVNPSRYRTMSSVIASEQILHGSQPQPDTCNETASRKPQYKSLSYPGRLFDVNRVQNRRSRSQSAKILWNRASSDAKDNDVIFFDRDDPRHFGVVEFLHELRYSQMLSESIEKASAEQKLLHAVKSVSVRQNARIMGAWVFTFFTLAITFFVHVGNLTLPDAMLFSVYTVTTAGFGSIKIPHTTGFLIAVIIFIYLGLASVTILAATLYQWTALNAFNTKQRIPASALEQSIIQRGKSAYKSSELGRAAISLSYLLLLLWTGTIAMMYLEDWNVVEAFFFATYVMTTVGYGSPVAPKSQGGTIFCVFWVPFNISFLSIYMKNLGRYYYKMSGWNTRRIEKQLHNYYLQLSSKEDEFKSPMTIITSSLTSADDKHLKDMKGVMHFVFTQMTVDDIPVKTSIYDFLSPEQHISLQKWLLLPSQWDDVVFASNLSRKPSLPLLLLVQERLAFIIAKDIACHTAPIITVRGEAAVCLSLGTLESVEQKWLIKGGPMKQAFRVVVLEAIMVIGLQKLVLHGADAILSLDPLEVLEIFAKLLAVMADAGTMEGWIARTQKLAEDAFPRSSYV